MRKISSLLEKAIEEILSSIMGPSCLDGTPGIAVAIVQPFRELV